MKLYFEDWLEKQNIDSESLSLFKESIVCYKAGAYRASILTSFMGFLSVVRWKILNSSKPDNIHEREWERIASNLRNDDRWDTETLECIKRTDARKVIFSISDDLRRQVSYWKDRRNDSAHSKRNKIDYAHVETLWLFISSKMGKFAVNGNMDSILLKIKRHYDIAYNSIGKPTDQLISEIMHGIEESEIETFCSRLHQLFLEEDRHYCNDFIIIISSDDDESTFLQFWNDLIHINETWERSVFNYMKTNEYLFDGFINVYPHKVGLLYSDSEFIRNLWYERIPSYINCYSVLSELFRHNLIEKSEHKEVFQRVINPKYDNLTEKDIRFFDQFGFSKVFEKSVFTERLIDDFGWGNANYRLVITYIKEKGLNELIVSTLNSVFDKYKYFPNTAQVNLHSFFNENPGIQK